MAIWRSTPYRRKSPAATAAMLVLAAFYAAPAIAASPNALQCDEDFLASLAISVDNLTASVVNHDIPSVLLDEAAISTDIEIVSSAEVLAPLAAAAIREAFSDNDDSLPQSEGTKLTLVTVEPLLSPLISNDAKQEAIELHEEPVDSANEMNARLPGVSDTDLSRFKRQMYRQDI